MALATAETYDCSRCGAAKPLSEFYLRPNGRPSVSRCRPCHREWRKEYAASRPEWERDYQRRKQRRRRERMLERDWIAARCAWGAYRLKVPADGLRAIFDAQGGRCALTGRELDAAMHLDHIVPRKRGGSDDLSNLRWVVEAANRAKRNLTDAEFVALCRDVVAHAS